MSTAPRYAAPALERGLDIMETLARARAPLSQTELARAMRRTSSGIFRMLNLLEKRGYLVKDEAGGRYQFSLRLYALAHSRNPVEALVRAAEGPMEALARATRESCHLGVLRGDQLVIVAQAHSPSPVRLSIDAGATFPALRTASGLLLAALLPEEERRRLFPRAETAVLRRASRAGWRVARDQTIRGVNDLAVAVPLATGAAALTVSWLAAPGEADKTRALLPAMRGCARQIVRRLGLEGLRS